MDIKDILRMQKIFGRTRTGRIIGKKLLPLIDNAINDPELNIESVVDCRNCFIVLSKNDFTSGCMNCGSKDISTLSQNL